MVTRPTPLTSSARMSNGHSMCASNRRSILSITGWLPCFVQAEERLQHLLGDRRGDGAAAAVGVLDERGDGDGRLLGRRVGDEPRVVALVPGQLGGRDTLLA